MSCSISEAAEMKLRGTGVISDQSLIDLNVVLVGCGVKSKCAFSIEMEVYSCKILVPTFVVP